MNTNLFVMSEPGKRYRLLDDIKQHECMTDAELTKQKIQQDKLEKGKIQYHKGNIGSVSILP